VYQTAITLITLNLRAIYCGLPRPLWCADNFLVPQAYEFEIQPYDEEEGGVRGDTGRWTPVIRGDAGNEDGRVPLGLSPLATATGLSPSTGYRFRVRLRDARGTGPVSGVSEVFTTGRLVLPFSLLNVASFRRQNIIYLRSSQAMVIEETGRALRSSNFL